MTRQEIVHHRLINQQIARPHCHTPGEVVSALGAVQAQDYLGALWSIGLRLPDSTEADVEQAIANRSIVRTWPMRGTLHFVAAADARWMLEFMAPRIIARCAGRHRQLELDAATFIRARKLFTRALQGGGILTRPAMFELLEKARISPKGQRGIHILVQLAMEGLLCFGPREGKQPTFTLLDEWLPDSKSKDRDASLAEIALRYFTGHGPATLTDFAGWTGLKLSEARAGLDAVSSKVHCEVIDGNTCWMLKSTPITPKSASDLHLLPGFDEYLLGYKDRSAALGDEHSHKIIPGGNGMFMPTIVINGRVAGLWKRAFKKDSVTVTASPFMPFKKSEARAFANAAGRYARFLGKELARS